MFSENLKTLLEEHELSKSEFAEMVGASKQSVSQWVNGHKIPRMNMLLTICEVLHCPLNALIDPDPTHVRQELTNVIHRLTENQVEQLLDFAKYLESEHEKK